MIKEMSVWMDFLRFSQMLIIPKFGIYYLLVIIRKLFWLHFTMTKKV